MRSAWGVHLKGGGGDYNPLFGPQLFMSVSHYRRTVLIRPTVPNSSNNNNKSDNLYIKTASSLNRRTRPARHKRQASGQA
jgi:hypothetical protein